MKLQSGVKIWDLQLNPPSPEGVKSDSEQFDAPKQAENEGGWQTARLCSGWHIANVQLLCHKNISVFS